MKPARLPRQGRSVSHSRKETPTSVFRFDRVDSPQAGKGREGKVGKAREPGGGAFERIMILAPTRVLPRLGSARLVPAYSRLELSLAGSSRLIPGTDFCQKR